MTLSKSYMDSHRGKVFTARTPAGLLLASALEIGGGVQIDKVQIGDGLEFVIKIDDEGWGDASIVDYRSALIVENLQKDILGIYNDITISNISLNDIYSYEDLIVRVRIEEGCLRFSAKIVESVCRLAENVSSKEKVQMLRLAFGIILTSGIAWTANTAMNTYRDIRVAELAYKEKIESKKLEYAIEKLKIADKKSEVPIKVLKAIQSNSETPKIISKIVKPNAQVYFGEAEVVSGTELKEVSKPLLENKDSETFYVDGFYRILQYNFDKQRVQLKKEGKRPFWADTANLNFTDKNRIKRLANLAIDNGKSTTANLWVSIEVLEQKIHSAGVVGVEAKRPREGSISLVEALSLRLVPSHPSTTFLPTQLRLPLP